MKKEACPVCKEENLKLFIGGQTGQYECKSCGYIGPLIISKEVKPGEKMKFNVGAVITEPGSTIKNKTAGWRAMKPVVDEKKCIKCGICWMFCPDSCIKIDKKKGAVIDYNFCKGDGICANVCPVKAIRMVKEEK
jgi:pyruvate ferredoxin oxidoreductase delta subunit